MRFEASRIRRFPGAVLGLALIFVFVLTGVAAAQGTQSGVVTGSVTSSDGAPLPGVTVTLTSPALQGERTAVTDGTGSYIFRGLPPGTYTLTYTLSGFGTVERRIELALGATEPLSPTMSVATVQESVEVTAEVSSRLSTTQVGENFRAETIDKLGTGRTIQNIAQLAPGLTTNTPNANQLSIAGAFAFDNVFLLNGVDVNDNLFGTPHNLFIEDAIEEVQVLTSGISAEFGRFSGGVVNAVTKRGGNKFSGSFRTDFTNPAWRDESTFEKENIAKGVAGAKPREDKLNKIYQATLGGPIVKDRLWFFVAGRKESQTIGRSLSLTGGSYNFEQINDRLEGKLTGSISANHTLQANYSRSPTKQNNNASINTSLSIDERTLVNRELPNNLFVANYNGVLTSNLFLEAQFSQKKFGFRKTGGTSTEIGDSPFLALGRVGIPASSHYNAPYFDSNDPEDRNNRQYTAALSYFLTTGSLGRHDLKVGGERFTSTRTGGNSQSSTSFRFLADPVVQGGVPVRDAAGFFIPMFQPGVTILDNWIAVRGAQIDLNTMSLYVNDRWQLGSHWSFNLGLRYERHTADTTQAGIATPESSAFVPRLGATFDVKGDGQWVLKATYGHYAGKASETQFADNTNVGTPNLVRYLYNGPAGQGVGFAPGFDIANYSVIAGSFPINNIFLDSGLATPLTKEWTLQAGTRLGRKGEVQLVFVNRKTTDFLDDFITLDRGRTTVTQNGRTFGTFDNVFITNTNLPNRSFRALEAQAGYRITDKWTFSGNYTLQVKNEGNFEGEAGNQPGNYSIIGDRPEFYSEARHYPTGRLEQYQRHRARVFSTYDIGLGRAGTASLGALYRYDSPQVFSSAAASVPITAIQRARNPGYANVPTTQTLFFGGRGENEFNSSHLFDFALNYELPVWKTARPWFKAELRNAFNKQPLIRFNTTITPDPNSPLDELGLPTGFTRGANFGKGTQGADVVGAHYPIPREFLLSVGFRF
jgi:outer membrane receptor for ferrienterochelin and colicin